VLVADLRSILAAAVAEQRLALNDQEVVNRFLTALAKHDSEQAEALISMFELLSFKKKPKRPAAVTEVASATSLAAELASVLHDDTAFERALDRIAADKKLTKAFLVALYIDLFGSNTGVPSKATRGDLVEIIRRERVKTARNSKMHSYLSGQKRVS